MDSTVVSFEAGTIADCMKKAARVAPAKVGSSFDKAAGIVLDIAPNTDAPCIVRATDTDVFYMETVDVVQATGDKVRWRLPSQLLANVIGTIPATAGKNVTFAQNSPSQVEISSGRMRAKLNLNANPFYPEWDTTDGLSLRAAPNFGGNITRVEWAASKNGPAPLNGVHLDGEYIVATDRYRIARVPCLIDLPNGPVTIPAGSIGQLLKQMGDVLVGVDEMLFVAMPDDYTQIKTITLGQEYISLRKITSLTYGERIEFSKALLVDKIQKAGNFAGADRSPVLSLYVGKGELAVFMSNEEVGLFGDVIELPSQADHPRTQIRFTPKMLLDALNNAPNDKVAMEYEPLNVKRPIHIDGDSGYEVWLAPRAENVPQP
jgi:DNA polymerase III sliding clamp (beta) subunit (PCNA family)